MEARSKHTLTAARWLCVCRSPSTSAPSWARLGRLTAATMSAPRRRRRRSLSAASFSCPRPMLGSQLADEAPKITMGERKLRSSLWGREGEGKGNETGNAEASEGSCWVCAVSSRLSLKNGQWPSTCLLCDTAERAAADGVKEGRERGSGEKRTRSVCSFFTSALLLKGEERGPFPSHPVGCIA